MKQITDWRYNDIALYAKGWYEPKDLFQDMGHIFEKIYGYFPDNMHEIARMMLRVLDDLRSYLEPGEQVWWDSFSGFFDNLERRSYDYDINTAIVYEVIAIVQGIERRNIVMSKPVFGKKEYFRMGCGLIVTYEDKRKNQTKTYKQMNKEAEKHFGK